MCRAVRCRQCGKTTWAGCGQHLDMVFAGVPRSERCEGHQQQASASVGGRFARMFGR